MPLAPEDQLLVACCRGDLPADVRAAAARLLDAPLSWDYLLASSARHGVGPLLRHGLIRVAAETGAAPPLEVTRELDRRHAESAARNDHLLGFVSELGAACDAAGVDLMAIKDVQLAVEVYAEPALRPLGDLDVLVRREQYGEVARLLADRGFSAVPRTNGPRQLAYGTGHHFRREDGLWVDVQWNVMQREWDLHDDGTFSFDRNHLWRDARRMALNGRTLLVPSPTDMLFHLCVHAEGHEYMELVLFCDIAELLRVSGSEVNWEELCRLARGYGSRSAVYWVLVLTRDLLGAPVPDGVLETLAPAFFDAPVYGPIYRSLQSLHGALDDLDERVEAPPVLLSTLETDVRRHAARARRLDAELRGVAGRFADRPGAGPVALLAGSSLRRFPASSLPAFEDAHVLVLEEQLPPLERALADAGFGRRGEAFEREAEWRSRDPRAAVRPLTLRIRAERAPAATLGAEVPPSNARVALRSLRLPQGRDDEEPVRLLLHGVSAEEALVELAVRVVRGEHALFAAVSVLDWLRRLPEPPDPDRLRAVAIARGVEREALSALAAVEGLQPGCLDRRHLGGLSTRLFRWARYGPSALERHATLRDGYLYALALRELQGPAARVRFLCRSLWPRAGRAPVAARLVAGLVHRPEAAR
jgi:hypothetical protein